MSAAMSLGKQDPPNPGPAWRNFEPIRWSSPIALATTWISAPTRSHRLAISLMKETLVARKALDAYLIISAEGRSVMTNGVDRKSTRLNSSHDQISYAVFCL